MIARVLAAALGLLVSFGVAKAQDLGSFVGPQHSVPAASCNPHCQLLGAGTPEGESYNFDDQIPSNAVLDAGKTSIQCSNPTVADGCGISGGLFGVTVDNLSHVVHIHGISHGPPLVVQAVVHIAAIH